MEEIKKFFKKCKWDSIIISILSVVLGILCIVMPNRSADVLTIVFGCSLIAIGITLFVRFISFDIIIGDRISMFAILMIILGIFCLIYPNTIQGILTVLFGLYIVVDSASTLNDSIYCSRAKTSGWLVLFILSLLSIVLGVAVMFSNFETVMIFAGVALIIEGIEHFVITIVYSRRINEAKKNIKEIIIEPEEDKKRK